MKKHIIGLIIFATTITAAVLINSFFSVETENIYAVKTQNCSWKLKMNPAINPPDVLQSDLIEQGTLDLSTRKMNWRMNLTQSSAPLALHFFVVNENGVKYVATEFAPSGFMDKSAQAGTLEFTSSYLWLDKLNAPQNLYVIPQRISLADYRAKNFDTKFDKEKAFSVLIYASGRK